MKHIRIQLPAFLIFAFVCSAAMLARADEWSKTYTLTDKPDLRVETTDANIHVSTWDQNTIDAKVTTNKYKIGEGGVHIEERQTGNLVEIKVRLPHEHGITINFGDHGRRVDVEIHMPREGSIDLNTGDGAIDLTQFKGGIRVHSGDGSQELNEVDGKLSASTGDGQIRVNGRFDELELKTGDGRIEARAVAGSAVQSGWRIETGDGSVTMDIPTTLAADVDIHTGDGHIDLDVPVVITAGRIRHNDVHGKINGGGNVLSIHTGNGSIRLSKS